MTQERVSEHPPEAGAGASGPPPAPAAPEIEGYSFDAVQRFVDQAAFYNFFALPVNSGGAALRGAGGEVIGIEVSETIHPIDISTEPSRPDACLRSTNVYGLPIGSLKLRWDFAPWDFQALPDRPPPRTAFDPTRTQRFTMQEASFTFDGGRDSFRSFGTGRTLPMDVGGEPRLVVGAVGNLMGGTGKFAGAEGNYVLCGELSVERGFVGHILLRIVDGEGKLSAEGEIPALVPVPDPEPGITFATWIAKKGEGPGQKNDYSIAPDGQVRGVNIPVDLRSSEIRYTPPGANGFKSRLEVGETVGLEIGFGRETQARSPGSGTALLPDQFEGVSNYTFYAPDGQSLGSFTVDFYEGRRFNVQMVGAPQLPGLRFSYYGAIMGGTGCLRGIRGMLYGSAGSVFLPPPSEHVISNLYVARLFDPDGRFSTAVGGT